MVLHFFVPVFLLCKMELVIVLTTYGIVRMKDGMMDVRCLAKPMQVFNKVQSCDFPTKSCRGSLRYLMLKTVDEEFFISVIRRAWGI